MRAGDASNDFSSASFTPTRYSASASGKSSPFAAARTQRRIKSRSVDAKSENLSYERDAPYLGATERTVMPPTLPGFGERRQVAIVIVRLRQDVEQPLHHAVIVFVAGRGERLFDQMVARNDGRVVALHQAFRRGGRLRLSHPARLESAVPRAEIDIFGRERQRGSRTAQRAKDVGEVGAAPRHPCEQVVGQCLVLRLGSE